MAKPTIRIYDVEKDELIDREMTEVEYKVYEADQKITLAKKVLDDAKENAKIALCERLGITVEEARLLLS